MTLLPRDKCPVCGRKMAVRRNGTMREHYIGPPGRRRLYVCKGTGQEPKPNPIRGAQLEIPG